MTRTEILEKEIIKIRSAHSDEIAGIPKEGPRGGRNAATIKEWRQSPNGTISKICNQYYDISMNHWDGSRRTPTVAIPVCIYDECLAAYEKIFG